MSVAAVRFLHVSDFQLGTPVFNVIGAPPELRSLLAQSRYLATERVFDTALAEAVDFVVIAGGVLGPVPGSSRGAWFFAEQCERLAARGIAVYWIEDSASRGRWLDYVPLPSNVFIGDSQVGQTFEHHSQSGETIRVVSGTDHLRAGDASRVPTIAVVPDGLEGLPLTPLGVDYWALGGRSDAAEAASLCGVARFAGTPQGGSPVEAGPRGCLLVTLDADRAVSTRLVASDVVRWHDEHVRVEGDIDWNRLRASLQAGLQRVARTADCNVVMVRWKLEGSGPVWRQLLREDVGRQMLQWLRNMSRSSDRCVWSLLIDLVADAANAGSALEEQPFAVGHERSGAPPMVVAGAGSAQEAGHPRPHLGRRRELGGVRGATQIGGL